MYCRNCGEPMNDNQAICLKCGVAVGNGTAFCANCGAHVNANAVACLSCGCKIAPEKAKQFNGQDKLTVALVCFFLGGLGIHNFIMGETKRGILKIVLTVLCGIGWIWALIDFVKILTDNYVPDPS